MSLTTLDETKGIVKSANRGCFKAGGKKECTGVK